MPLRPVRPRLDDVAAHAGTSAITVSRALRDPSKVARATRERIDAAIRALGYIPNLSASSLASRRSRIVGLLLPTIGNSIFTETAQGVADALRPSGLQLLLGDAHYSETEARGLLGALLGRQPEALIVIGMVSDAAQRSMIIAAGIPVVETWDLTGEPIDTVVGFSNEAAGRAVAEHFVARDRSRLAFMGGADRRARLRHAGFATVAREIGLPDVADIEVRAIGIAAGRAAIAGVIERGAIPDALFCATDILAIGAILECRDRGLAVPGRIAVVGLGDLEIGREIRPSLTTVVVPSYDIGRIAGEIVIARLDGRAPRTQVIDLGFAIRDGDSTSIAAGVN